MVFSLVHCPEIAVETEPARGPGRRRAHRSPGQLHSSEPGRRERRDLREAAYGFCRPVVRFDVDEGYRTAGHEVLARSLGHASTQESQRSEPENLRGCTMCCGDDPVGAGQVDPLVQTVDDVFERGEGALVASTLSESASTVSARLSSSQRATLSYTASCRSLSRSSSPSVAWSIIHTPSAGEDTEAMPDGPRRSGPSSPSTTITEPSQVISGSGRGRRPCRARRERGSGSAPARGRRR